MKVWVVSTGQYSDYEIVAIKSNEEAARRLMKKCSYCHGTGEDPFFPSIECYSCGEDECSPGPQDNWNEPKEMEVEDN